MIAAVLAALAVAAPTYGPDQIHYELDVEHTRHELTGSAKISFHNPFDTPMRTVWLRRWDGAFRDCRPCTRDRVELAEPVAPDATGTIEVPVDIRVPRTYDRYGSLGKVDFFGNGLPTLAVSADGARPKLPPYTFAGESFFTLTARWTVKLQLRPGEQVASTGTRTARDGNTVTLEAPAERDFMIVAGPMQVLTRKAGGIRVRWFSRRGTSLEARRTGLRRAVQSITAQQRRLGPYGAPEFDAVQTPGMLPNGATAMEYPQLILSPTDRASINHEIGHQWFYRLVGNDQWHSPWVDETMTSFVSNRLGRRLNGIPFIGCDRRMRIPADANMGVFERRGSYGLTIYGTAPCILRDLERRIGTRRMDAFLRGIVAEFRGGVLTSEQLAAGVAALPTGKRALRALRVRGGAGR